MARGFYSWGERLGSIRNTVWASGSVWKITKSKNYVRNRGGSG